MANRNYYSNVNQPSNGTAYTLELNNNAISDFQRRVLEKLKNKTSFVRQVSDRSFAMLGMCHQNPKRKKKKKKLKTAKSEWNQAHVVSAFKQNCVTPVFTLKPADPASKSDIFAPVCKQNLDAPKCKQDSFVESGSDTRTIHFKIEEENMDVNNNVVTSQTTDENNKLKQDDFTQKFDENSNILEGKVGTEASESDEVEAGVKEKERSESLNADDYSEEYESVEGKAVVFCLLCKSHVARQMFPFHLKGRKHIQMKAKKKNQIKIDKVIVKAANKAGASAEVPNEKRPLIKRIEGNIRDQPVRQYTRDELLELQHVPATRNIPDSLDKDFIVDGIWNANKFNAFHKGRPWKTHLGNGKNPKKRPADLWRESLACYGILAEVPTEKRPLIKRIKGYTRDQPVRRYTRDELLELQDAPATRNIPDSLDKDFVVDGIWNANKFNAFHKGQPWKTHLGNGKNPKKRPAELLSESLAGDGILEKRRKLAENESSSNVTALERTKKKKSRRKTKENKKPYVIDRALMKYPFKNFIPKTSSQIPSPEKQMNSFAFNVKTSVEENQESDALSQGVTTTSDSQQKCLRSVMKPSATEPDDIIIIPDSDDSDKEIDKHRHELDDPHVIMISSDDSSEIERQGPLDKSIKLIYCPVCKSHVESENWCHHMRGKRHRLKRKKKLDNRCKKNIFEICIDQLKKQADKRKYEYRRGVENSSSSRLGLNKKERQIKSISTNESTKEHETRTLLKEKKRKRQKRKDCSKKKFIESHTHSRGASTLNHSEHDRIKQMQKRDRDVKKAHTMYTATVENMKDIEETGMIIDVEGDNEIQNQSLSDLLCSESTANSDYFGVDTSALFIATSYIPEYTPLDNELPVPSLQKIRPDLQAASSNMVDVRSTVSKPNIRYEAAVINMQESLSSGKCDTKFELSALNGDTSKTGSIIQHWPFKMKCETGLSKPELPTQLKGTSNAKMQENVDTGNKTTTACLPFSDMMSMHKLQSFEEDGEADTDFLLSAVQKKEDLNAKIPCPSFEEITEYAVQEEDGSSKDTNDVETISEIIAPNTQAKSSDLAGKQKLPGTGGSGNVNFDLSSTLVQKEDKSNVKTHSSSSEQISSNPALTEDLEWKIKSESVSDALIPSSTSYLSNVKSETAATSARASVNAPHGDTRIEDHRNCVAVFPWGVDRNTEMLELHHSIPCKLAVKVAIPEEKYPWINYSERLLEAGCNSLEQIQWETGCLIHIKGPTSEVFLPGGVYLHKYENPHVLIESYGQAEIAFERLADAIGKIKDCFTRITEDAINWKKVHRQAVEYNPQNYMHNGSCLDYHRHHSL